MCVYIYWMFCQVIHVSLTVVLPYSPGSVLTSIVEIGSVEISQLCCLDVVKFCA